MNEKNEKKEKVKTTSKKQLPIGNSSNDWLDFLKTIKAGTFVQVSQKDHDLKKVRKVIKRLQKKNLTEVEYAIGGTKGNRFIYIIQPKEG